MLFNNKLACFAHLQPASPKRLTKQLRIIKVAYNPYGSISYNNTPPLMNRKSVREISLCGIILFVIYDGGECIAFNEETGKVMGQLNNKSQRIKTIYHNSRNKSMLVVFNETELNWHFLRAYIFPEGSINWNDAKPLLSSNESISGHGYLELDETNSVILARLTNPSIIKVWDLLSSTVLFTFDHYDVEEVRFSLNILALLGRIVNSELKVCILDARNGTVLTQFIISHKNDSEFEYIEAFGKYLLIKQKDKELVCMNCFTLEKHAITNSQNTSPKAFIFLPHIKMFYAFDDKSINLYHMQHGKLTNIKQISIAIQNPNSEMYYSKNQDIIYLYCKSSLLNNDCKKEKPLHSKSSFSINRNELGSPMRRPRKSHNSSMEGNIIAIKTGEVFPCFKYKAKISDMIGDRSNWGCMYNECTSIHMCKDRDVLYVGNDRGVVTKWSIN